MSHLGILARGKYKGAYLYTVEYLLSEHQRTEQLLKGLYFHIEMARY